MILERLCLAQLLEAEPRFELEKAAGKHSLSLRTGERQSRRRNILFNHQHNFSETLVRLQPPVSLAHLFHLEDFVDYRPDCTRGK